MVYAYDQWALYPVRDLYDTLMMLASINAAKDMYEKGAKELKDFKKEYGDFFSDVSKDLDWHNENVTGKIKNTINDLYAAGIDPIRSSEGRYAIARAINDIDLGRIARNRVTAKNAATYLQNKAALEAAGKYDSDLEERFLGYNLNDFSSENGVWDRLSPAEAKSLKSLTESSFNNRTPHLLTEQDVKDFNLPYDPRAQYEGFTYKDLLNIANTVAPGLKGTMHYDYYRDLAKNELQSLGVEDPSEEQITAQLARDIANSQQEYIIKPGKPDYSNWYQNQNLILKQQAARIASGRARARNGNDGGSNPNKKPIFDYNDFLIGTTAANILRQTTWGARIGIGGVSDYDPETAGKFIKSAQHEIAENTYDYNVKTAPLSASHLNKVLKFKTLPSLNEQIHESMRKNILSRGGIDIGSYENNFAGKTINFGATTRPTNPTDAAEYDERLHNQNLEFLSKLSMPYNEENFAKGMGRKRDNDNSDYVLMNERSDVGRIYSADEVALTSAGVDRPTDASSAIQKTKSLRKQFSQNFDDGKTMMKSEGFVVGRVGDADGAYHLFQKVRIVNKYKTPADSKEKETADFGYTNLYKDGEVVYYDMGIDTQESPNFKLTGEANMTPLVTDQSFALDRAVLSNLGLSGTNVKSDESVPDIYNSYDFEEDYDLLDLMGD